MSLKYDTNVTLKIFLKINFTKLPEYKTTNKTRNKL